MITNIWTNAQPNKKKSYPDCKPIILLPRPNGADIIKVVDLQDNEVFLAMANTIARVEFRP